MRIEVLDVSLNTIEKVKKFTNIANSFDCDVDVLQGRYIVAGKSIMGIFSLNLTETVTVEIESDNEKEIDRFLKKMEEFR
jgi:phosphotransferase system HPr-like phosphotransfer protein